MTAFATLATVDARALNADATALDVELDPETMNAGFRPGVEWFSIYKQGEKIGFIRNQRIRDEAVWTIRTTTEIRTASLGPSATRLQLEANFAPNFDLRDFRADVQSPAVVLNAQGRREGDQIHIDLDALGGGTRLKFPADAAPRLNQSVFPQLLQSELRPGARYRFELFDPLSMQSRDTIIEYLGRESVDVMGASVEAHHLRTQDPTGMSQGGLDTWVNGLGEVLREELPGGLVAVRESEAEAVWGLPNAAASRVDEDREANP